MLVYIIRQLIKPAPVYTPPPPKPKPVMREFSREELRELVGKDGGRICMAIKGRVYDVSGGRAFYGPGGGYPFVSNS